MLDWANNKHKAEILFVKYEDLKRDIVASIRNIAEFLNITIADAHLKMIVRDVDIKHMKADKAIEFLSIELGAQVRSGQYGGWKKYFTVEQNEWFDNKYKKLYEELDIDVDYD